MDSEKKKYLYGAVALVLLAILVFASQFLGGDEEAPRAVEPSSQETAYVDDEETASDDPEEASEAPEPSDEPSDSAKGLTVPPEAREAASNAIRVYTQWSYTDPSPNSWRDRLEKIATDVYIHSLDDTFGNDASVDNYWINEVVPNEQETKTEVLDVYLEEGKYDNTPTEMTFVVRYKTAMRSVDYPNWTNPEEEMSQFVTVVKQRGRWLVDDIVPTRIPS